MRIAGWGLLTFAALGAWSMVADEQPLIDMTRVASFWWGVPLVASLTSALVLAASAVAGRLKSRGISAVISSSAYLVPGPSLAVLNLVPTLELGAAPPPWVEGIMLCTLLASAWIFYGASREPADQMESVPRFEAIC